MKGMDRSTDAMPESQAAFPAAGADILAQPAALPVPAFSLLFTVCLLISLAFQSSAQSAVSGSAEVGAAVSAAAILAESRAGRVLYIYDEVNEQSSPYIGHFRAALAASGVEFDEAAAADLTGSKTGALPKVNLASYDRIIVHGMVMAFNSKSPVRDWLKKKPDLSGKKVSLFVTANRWFLDNLFGQLTDLIKKDGADLIDAVSMATKTTTDSDERAAVGAQVARFAGK